MELINTRLLQDVGHLAHLQNTVLVGTFSHFCTILRSVHTQLMENTSVTLMNVKPVKIQVLLLSQVVPVIVVSSNVDQINNVRMDNVLISFQPNLLISALALHVHMDQIVKMANAS